MSHSFLPCIIPNLLYTCCCRCWTITDFKNFHVLMLGRLLGGVATSLLFSVFDAWLIRSHADAKLKSYIGRSFSVACYGNYLVAILSGIFANHAASITPMRPLTQHFYIGGYLAPFDLALLSLLACGVVCMWQWDENYGDTDSSRTSSEHAAWYNGLRSAAVTTFRSYDVLLCGMIASLFEGSMYIFVFMWTPALTTHTSEELPFGLIFSTFMVSCMAGSSAYALLEKQVKGEKLAVGIFAVAAASMFLVAVSSNNTIKFIGMNLFEVTVGLYWPTMGTMKGAIVPEAKRAAIYNLFRIPLNCIVLFSLLTDLTPTTSFLLNTLMLSAAAAGQVVLMKRREQFLGASTASSSSSPSKKLEVMSDNDEEASSGMNDALLGDHSGDMESIPSENRSESKKDDDVVV
jgi:MFS transporter, MFS domain-containing protein family, molybdate-anion transporter